MKRIAKSSAILATALTPFVLPFLPPHARAAELPLHASVLIEEHEKAVDVLGEPLDTLADQYRGGLERIAEKYRGAGDLGGVLAVQAEIETLEKLGDVKPAPGAKGPGDLVSARAIYKREREKRTNEITRQLAGLEKTFLKKLEALVPKLTRDGDVEGAVAIKEYIDTLPPPGAIPIGATYQSMRLRFYLPEKSFFKLRGNEVWWDHTNGYQGLPGERGGEAIPHPTFINGDTKWMPTWQSKVSKRTTAPFWVPMKGTPPEVTVKMLEGRGRTTVVGQPTEENDYTATIWVCDTPKKSSPKSGAAWMEVEVKWGER